MEDRTVVAHGCRKTKMIICGMGGEHVVAYDRLAFSRSSCQLELKKK